MGANLLVEPLMKVAASLHKNTARSAISLGTPSLFWGVIFFTNSLSLSVVFAVNMGVSIYLTRIVISNLNSDTATLKHEPWGNDIWSDASTTIRYRQIFSQADDGVLWDGICRRLNSDPGFHAVYRWEIEDHSRRKTWFQVSGHWLIKHRFHFRLTQNNLSPQIYIEDLRCSVIVYLWNGSIIARLTRSISFISASWRNAGLAAVPATFLHSGMKCSACHGRKWDHWQGIVQATMISWNRLNKLFDRAVI